MKVATLLMIMFAAAASAKTPPSVTVCPVG